MLLLLFQMLSCQLQPLRKKTGAEQLEQEDKICRIHTKLNRMMHQAKFIEMYILYTRNKCT
jgi:hypothetical protein